MFSELRFGEATAGAEVAAVLRSSSTRTSGPSLEAAVGARNLRDARFKVRLLRRLGKHGAFDRSPRHRPAVLRDTGPIRIALGSGSLPASPDQCGEGALALAVEQLGRAVRRCALPIAQR